VVQTDKVLLSSPFITANSNAFFSHPDEWDPHRWDGTQDEDNDNGEMDFGDPSSYSKGTRSPYLPFGAGRHRCIGEKFAYLNLQVIVATLVREFRFYNLDDSKNMPATDYTSLFSGPVRPTPIRWERRMK
jgi:sterol 14-demethylase